MKKYLFSLIAVGIFSLVLLPASTVNAQELTYYVDSVTGSDSNDGLTELTPWQSLNKVTNTALQPGDTVLFKRGSEWTGELWMTSSGTEALPVTYSAYGEGALPVLHGPTGQWLDVVTLNADWVIVENLYIRDVNEHGIEVWANSDNNVMRNLELSHVGAGVGIRGGTNNTITESYFHDATMIVNDKRRGNDFGAHGVIIYGGSGVKINNNTFRNMIAPSIDYDWDGSVVEIFGNVSNLEVMYNKSYNSDTFFEIGGAGSVQTNMRFAYNEIIETRIAFWIHMRRSTVNNIFVENNTFTKTSNELVYSAMGFTGNPSADTAIVRNNIFKLTYYQHISNVDGYIHTNNLYDLGYIQLIDRSALTFHPTEIVASAQFADEVNGDYTLSATSPAVDTGVEAGYTMDLAGTPVPQGIAPDMGSWEYIAQ